jgi:hypothetical protein
MLGKAVAVALVLAAGLLLAVTLVGRATARRPPKVAILCPSGPEDVKWVEEALVARGLVKDVDFRLEAFLCAPPNTPRQAVVNAVGSESQLMVQFGTLAQPALQEAKATAMTITKGPSRQLDELVSRLKGKPGEPEDWKEIQNFRGAP